MEKVSAIYRKLGMTRQNYYARRKQQQREQVESELVVALVQRERQQQPRIGTRKLQVMLQGELLALAFVRPLLVLRFGVHPHHGQRPVVAR